MNTQHSGMLHTRVWMHRQWPSFAEPTAAVAGKQQESERDWWRWHMFACNLAANNL